MQRQIAGLHIRRVEQLRFSAAALHERATRTAISKAWPQVNRAFCHLRECDRPPRPLGTRVISRLSKKKTADSIWQGWRHLRNQRSNQSGATSGEIALP